MSAICGRSMPIVSESKLKLADEVLFRDFEEESVLLNLADESYYGLDRVGTEMWKAVSETASVGEAISRMMDGYDTDEETIKTDFIRLMNELCEKGIVVIDG
ncbi:MAG: hypothetical protein ACI9R3_006548 [Verrucomicrobiales bacterium]|jgi:hypothetical protein